MMTRIRFMLALIDGRMTLTTISSLLAHLSGNIPTLLPGYIFADLFLSIFLSIIVLHIFMCVTYNSTRYCHKIWIDFPLLHIQ
jgi:hypothetical protein